MSIRRRGTGDGRWRTLRNRPYANLHHLTLDLAKVAKAGLQTPPAGALRNKHAREPHKSNHVARAEQELLHAPVDTGADESLSRFTCASAIAASALAFSAGNTVEIRKVADCLEAVAASMVPCR